MTSTKLMWMGILIILLGLALNSVTTQLIAFRTIDADTTLSIAYIASALFVIGFVIGVIGFFRG